MDDPRAARCAAMYRTGVKTLDIRDRLRCDSHAIYRWLREAGVPLRGKGTGPNAVTWRETRWNLYAYARVDGKRWDIDACIRISEARNAAIIANDCSGFPRVPLAA